ncbi:hypothetical protein CN096_39595 [Sinorhizobium meliloti]|nr:hypothetical protein CN122_31900 [Sinorhizobium meliloti]RVP75704.1 hypothetical protein CN096_39595 [Sinorhizobium meliloti]
MIEARSSSSVAAARQVQRRQFKAISHHVCDRCERVPSISEMIERFCESCEQHTTPVKKEAA